MTSVFQTEALVLRSRDFGEKDVLLTLLSKERGKFSIICKGVKKSASRLRSSAQLFSHARFFLFEGKSIPVATQAELIECYPTISSDLQKFAVASYWSELAEYLLPEKEMNFHAYLLFLKALSTLDDNSMSWPLFFFFQIKLLALAGFQPVADNCASCGSELGEKKFLSITAGGTVCLDCRSGSKQVREGTVQALRFFDTAKFETIIKLNIAAPIVVELSKYLTAFVEHHAERQMRSATFLHNFFPKEKNNLG